MQKKFDWQHFINITLIVSIWVNASEVFRYFVLVMPRVKAYWNNLAHVADMNWIIFGIWGLWDTILTAMIVLMYWLYAQVFGHSLKSALTAGFISWIFFFVLFWIGAANMGLSPWSLLFITLPLSLLELLVASWVASLLYQRMS